MVELYRLVNLNPKITDNLPNMVKEIAERTLDPEDLMDEKLAVLTKYNSVMKVTEIIQSTFYENLTYLYSPGCQRWVARIDKEYTCLPLLQIAVKPCIDEGIDTENSKLVPKLVLSTDRKTCIYDIEQIIRMLKDSKVQETEEVMSAMNKLLNEYKPSNLGRGISSRDFHVEIDLEKI